MNILHDIEHGITRIETDVKHVISLWEQHLAADAGALGTAVEHKISGLKTWLAGLIQHEDAKADHVAADLKGDMKKL